MIQKNLFFEKFVKFNLTNFKHSPNLHHFTFYSTV